MTARTSRSRRKLTPEKVKEIADRAEGIAPKKRPAPKNTTKKRPAPKSPMAAKIAEKKKQSQIVAEKLVLESEEEERRAEAEQERAFLFPGAYAEPPEPLNPKAGASKYNSKIHPGLARKLVLAGLGGNDSELADFLGVHVTTIAVWRANHSEFAEALVLDESEQINQSVERALYQRATGYTFDSEKIVSTKDGVVRVAMREHVHPDVGAARYWLENRVKDGATGKPKWRDSKNIQLSGDAENPIAMDGDNSIEFARRMAFMLSQAQTSKES